MITLLHGGGAGGVGENDYSITYYMWLRNLCTTSYQDDGHHKALHLCYHWWWYYGLLSKVGSPNMTPPNWHWEKNDDHHEDYDHRYIYHDHFTIISPGGSHLGCCWENGLHHHYYQDCNNLSWFWFNDLTRLESSRLALESEQEIQRDRLLNKSS